MNDDQIKVLADAWLLVTGLDEGDPLFEENVWALSDVEDFYQVRPDLAWRFILEAYKRPLTIKEAAILAAGPIEGLICYHGPDYIDRIEELAENDELFRYILGGVWRLGGTDDVWARMERAKPADFDEFEQLLELQQRRNEIKD